MTQRTISPAGISAGTLLLAAITLVACAQPMPPQEGVVEEAGGGLLHLAVSGATASMAVERGLNQATRHCAERNGLVSVQSTQIEQRGYRVSFRCLESATPGLAMAARTDAAPFLSAAPLSAAPAIVAPRSVVTGEPLAPGPISAAPPATSGLLAPGPLPAQAAPLLPAASRPLPPIAAGVRSTQVAARPPAASSFWQAGR